MNLLRTGLERHRFRPVWFNAWHHQKERHLFAAVLEAVRSQAVLPWWSVRGLTFRGRLLRKRTRAYPVWTFLVLVLFGVSLGVPAANWTPISTAVWSRTGRFGPS